MKKIAIFASGGGSNAMKIIRYFKNSEAGDVVLLVTNNSKAGILETSKGWVKQEVISNEEAKNGMFLINLMEKNEIDYLVLAGYLRKIPTALITKFPQHIINIHPALLPKYGGKGMYGMNVHKAVFEAQEKESGISIHLVNENYDDGAILAQQKVAISSVDTPETIQKKVLKIEHQYFAPTIEKYLLEQNA